MAVQKKTLKKGEAVKGFKLMDNIPVPPVVKASKYPWEELAEHEPLAKSFFVECKDKEEAITLKPSIYASGKNYYEKRGIDLIPKVRVMELPDELGWGVMAWADSAEEEEEDE